MLAHQPRARTFATDVRHPERLSRDHGQRKGGAEHLPAAFAAIQLDEFAHSEKVLIPMKAMGPRITRIKRIFEKREMDRRFRR
ncbi:MAG: hypothetical protein QM755_20615 [Luteolibacter sp.]